MRSTLLALVACGVASTTLAQTHPSLFKTPAQEAIWARMKADYEANKGNPATNGGKWYKKIKTDADCQCRDGDHGFWAALMYRMSGDRSYVPIALSKMNRYLLGMDVGDLNGRREYAHQWVTVYDWIYDGLTASERSTILTKLNAIATSVDRLWAANLANRHYGDTDQLTGEYFFIVVLYLATGDYNSTIQTIWGHSWVGGYTSTWSPGTSPKTARETISHYIDQASGGEWVESDEYNLLTMNYLKVAHAVNLKTGVNHYPEVMSWFVDAAARMPQQLTPDLKEPFQWGTEEIPNFPRWFYRVQTMMWLQGLTKATDAGKRLGGLINELVNRYGTGTLGPFWQGFALYDPYAETLPYTAIPTDSFATGWQVFNYRTGWNKTDSFFGAHYSPRPRRFDHQPTYFGMWRLYKNGEWIFDGPMSYDGVSGDARGTSGLTVAGVPAGQLFGPNEYGKVTARSVDAGNGFVYLTGTMGGQIFNQGHYNPPRVFADELTRSLVYLPALNTVVVHDRANASNPFPKQEWEVFFADILAWMQSRPLKELYVNTRVEPTLGAGFIEWPLLVNGTARVYNLHPTDVTRTPESQRTVWAKAYGAGSIHPTEYAYHVRIVPNTPKKWDTFLNVWTHYTGTPTMRPTLVRDTRAMVDAAFLASASGNYLLAFNALQGPDLANGLKYPFATYPPANRATLASVRIRKASFSLAFTVPRGSTRIVLFDLDESARWDYTLNSGAAGKLTVSSEGIGVISTALTGTVTLQVTADRSR